MNNESIINAYHRTREQSKVACKPLVIEDYGLQAEAFTSPPKWHLAHTSWFFETFLLKPFLKGYQVFNPAFEVLFNSYYNSVGEQFPRAHRGLISRPTVSEVMLYREHIDAAMKTLLEQSNHPDTEVIFERCRLGIEHEKQHQELFFTDLKYCLSKNSLYPSYVADSTHTDNSPTILVDINWVPFKGGLIEIGVNVADIDFCFDNESPAHQTFLPPFALANRLVTNAEFQAFIDAGGYQKPEYWLADGWELLQQNLWTQPLYWLDLNGQALEYTLYGLKTRNPHQAVCHVSAYEADAYASWAGARLATEDEWEYAALQAPVTAQAIKTLHPQQLGIITSDENKSVLFQLYDNCWQWTASAYRPYPGFETAEGAIGEYNGKFMCNQWVLRGGSCVTSENHVRPTYRNFFYPDDRWQFTGIRLAKKQ
jgi:ergothioneine biosynthesis protein EgtB